MKTTRSKKLVCVGEATQIQLKFMIKATKWENTHVYVFLLYPSIYCIQNVKRFLLCCFRTKKKQRKLVFLHQFSIHKRKQRTFTSTHMKVSLCLCTGV